MSLNAILRRQLRANQKVENLVRDVIQSLLGYPPANRLIRSDDYMWRISCQLLNPANRRLRRNSERTADAVDEAEDWIVGLSRTEDLGSVLEWIAYREQIKQSLARLTVEEFDSLIMACRGDSYKEIAARMHISVESLRSHLRRAYLTLKASAAEPGPEQSPMADQTSDQTPYPSSEPDVEATEWLIRLMEMNSNSGVTTAARQKILDEVNLWAARSPANLRSLLDLAIIFEAMGECWAEVGRELGANVDSDGNVGSLAPPEGRPAMTELSAHIVKPKVRKMWAATIALAATLVMGTVGVQFWHGTNGGTTYRTRLGEWQHVRLDDGSMALLGERSEIRGAFSGETRRIVLRGEAVFDVAKDSRRPFFVITDNAEIQALGTRFDVDYRGGPTRVTVVDGSVRVDAVADQTQSGSRSLNGSLSATDAPPRVPTRTVTGREGVEVSGQNISVLDQAEVENTIASQREVLVLDHKQQLSVVAARINFWSRRQIRIADSVAGRKPIDGRYKTDQPEKLMLAVQELYPDLAVRETYDGWTVAERAPAVHAR